MSELDPRRFGNYVTKRWTVAKVRQTWGTHMEAHVPAEDRPAARPAKTTPSYDFLTAKGAVWTVMDGYEFPRWFAPSPEFAIPEHSFRRTEHMKYVDNEVRAVREAAGMIDMSPMTKFMVRGPGATAWLDGLLANSLPTTGRVGLCVACTDSGGIKAEYTVIRYGDNDYYLVSSPACEVLNWDELTKALPADSSVTLENVSESMGVIALAGPESREILQPLTDIDLANSEFPWLAGRIGEVGYANGVHLIRISYTGELGWELHHPIGYNRHLVETLLNAGEPYGLKLFGLEAFESLRLEKSYRAIHRELTTDITALEAGLDRFVKPEKGNFVGRAALQAQLDGGLRQRMVTLKLPLADTSVLAAETVYKDGKTVGRVTSGGYSYHFAHDIALALIDIDASTEGNYLQVMIHNELREAKIVPHSMYDPNNLRVRM